MNSPLITSLYSQPMIYLRYISDMLCRIIRYSLPTFLPYTTQSTEGNVDELAMELLLLLVILPAVQVGSPPPPPPLPGSRNSFWSAPGFSQISGADFGFGCKSIYNLNFHLRVTCAMCACIVYMRINYNYF